MFLFRRWICASFEAASKRTDTSSAPRSKLPRYGFFILNRHSTENFLEDLIDEESLELTPEYIIVQGADGQPELLVRFPYTDMGVRSQERIHGIWVFEEEHRERIAQRMMEWASLPLLLAILLIDEIADCVEARAMWHREGLVYLCRLLWHR